MELATELETKRFLGGLFYAWGQELLQLISRQYGLDKEQQEALELLLLKPNNWRIEVKDPLTALN